MSDLLSINYWRFLIPGIIVSAIVGVASYYLGKHTSMPAMLLALVFGIGLSFLGRAKSTSTGIAFSSRTLLRLGVALLGMRISFTSIMELGSTLIVLVIAAMLATIAFGLFIGRFFGSGWRFSLLTAGSVAICGASAAMAISAILPKDERSEERLIFTVLGVTILSTIAMIAYPFIAHKLGLSSLQAGVFFGGAIHDVAQVVGAGYSIDTDTGDTATLVKLIRVTMLAPIVLIASLVIRQFVDSRSEARRPPLLPSFVLGFLVLATVNSFGLIPQTVAAWGTSASKWLLLIAIAAVGMKTNIKSILSVGGSAIALIVVETLFIGGFVLVAIFSAM